MLWIYVTAWRRLKRWSEEGIWFQILCGISEIAYIKGNLSIDTVSVDSTLIDSKKVETSQIITATREEKASKFMLQ
jgi:hypothetical protein